jgi:hypothetical protein
MTDSKIRCRSLTRLDLPCQRLATKPDGRCVSHARGLFLIHSGDPVHDAISAGTTGTETHPDLVKGTATRRGKTSWTP